MKLRGLSVTAQTEQGHTITPLPSGARRMLKGNALLLLIDLCESLPKSNKHGEQLHTKSYPGLRALILDRTGIEWRKSQLSEALKTLINAGVVRRTAEGDLEIVYEAFDQPGLYSQRTGQTSAQPTAEPAKRPQPQPALTASEAPVIDAKPQQVAADISPDREKVLADAAHHNSEAKLRAQRHRNQRLQEEIRRDEHLGGESSYAAWMERQQAAKDDYRRSIHEPEVPAAVEPDQPLEQELSDFMKKKLGIGVLTRRERDELALEQETATSSSFEPVYINGVEQW